MCLDKLRFHKLFLLSISFILIVIIQNTETHSKSCKHHQKKSTCRQSLSSLEGGSLDKSSQTEEPIIYRLDTWSQYDNPEEGNAREGDIHELPLYRKTTTRDQNLLWPDGRVYYYLDHSMLDNPSKIAVLEDAMANIMEKTCIRFERVRPNSMGQFPVKYWVNVTGSEKGCFSDLGCNKHGPSLLNLDVNRCFRTKGHALHEILHTLGIYHEHMRPDRDHFITILWGNINDGNAFNFRMLDKTIVTNYGLPYDYDSVMHYSMTAFSKDKAIPTIVPKVKFVEIGQRNHLSYYDIKKLLITYRCTRMDIHQFRPDRHYHKDQLEFLNLNKTDYHHHPSLKKVNNYDFHYDILRSTLQNDLARITSLLNENLF